MTPPGNSAVTIYRVRVDAKGREHEIPGTRRIITPPPMRPLGDAETDPGPTRKGRKGIAGQAWKSPATFVKGRSVLVSR